MARSPQLGGPSARSVGALAAAGVPFAVYVATASGHGYWLDGREFVAASIDLGIAHPPGHPLHALTGKLPCLLPFGPLAFRVAVASALAAAVGAAALFVAIARTLACLEVRSRAIQLPIALGTSWLVALGYAYWYQAVRPEVYALTGALCCVALERLTAAHAALAATSEGGEAHGAGRALIGAALALGLGLANNHAIAIAMLPAMLPVTLALLGARRLRALSLAVGAGLLGLLTYLYLPLRALNEPVPNLGAPTDLARFFWVVSARTFQGNVGSFAPEPYPERLEAIALLFGLDLHLWLLLVPGGLYLMLRRSTTRGLGATWALALVVPTALRIVMGFIRNNPDAAGYLLPSYAAAGCLGAALLGVVANALSHSGLPRAALVLAALAPALGLAQLPVAAPRASLADFTQTEAHDGPLVRDVPPRALILAYSPATVFQLWGNNREERARPDVTVLPMPFLHYPGMREALARNEPALAAVLRGSGPDAIDHRALRSLARTRPVLVEPDPRVPLASYSALSPAGLYLQLGADGAGVDPEPIERRLYRDLGAGTAEPRTAERLLWRHFSQALYFMGSGRLDAASRALARAHNIAPKAEPLAAMAAALARARPGEPIDVRPFLEALERPPPAH